MLESYKELIAAKAEIKMLKKQLAESKQIICCKDCQFYDPEYYGPLGACLKESQSFDGVGFICSKHDNDFCSDAEVKPDAQNNDSR